VQRHSIDGQWCSPRYAARPSSRYCCAPARHCNRCKILCVYLLQDGYTLGAELGSRLGAMIALIILTGVFCIIFWLLKVVRSASAV